MYEIKLTKQTEKDAVKIERSGLKEQVKEIIKTIRINPYEQNQGFEKLKGELKGSFSRRVNKKHRVVYEILPKKQIKIISMWTHYE